MGEQLPRRLNVVFIHGILSSAKTWVQLRELLEHDEKLSSQVNTVMFEYSSPGLILNPSRRIPDINTIADSLRTFLENELDPEDPVLFVAHSQGGLIAQRYLVREMDRTGGESLRQVRGLIMYATPNSGSEFFLSVRKTGLRRNFQERELRPLAQSVAETLRSFLQKFVFTTEAGPNQHPMRVTAYAGESDAIVPPASAHSVFKIIGILPGDHSTIIRPESRDDLRYKSLEHAIREALDGQSQETVNVADDVPTAPPPPQTVDAIRARAEIVRALGRIKEFRDDLARRVILTSYLPEYIYDGVPSQVATNLYLIALVQECERYDAQGKVALLTTIIYGCPEEDPAVAAAVAKIKRWWGVVLPDEDGEDE